MQKKMWALGITAALTAAFIGFFTPTANATSNPPWEPDPQALGTITFYDASGNVVTSGTDLTHVFTYAAASTPTPASRTGTTKAFTSYAFPDHTKTTGQYFATPAGLATFYPVTSPTAPADIRALTNPVATGNGDLTGVLGQGTFDSTTGYNDVLQVRLGDSGPGIPQDSTVYWNADILVNTTTHAWTQIYPVPVAGPTTTTTTLSPSVASPQPHGTNITFTATVTPTAAGSVIFSDNGTAISSAVTVTSGHAAFATTALAVGPHSITAAFTPADPTAFTTSTSSGLSYSITSSAVTTTTSLGVTPTSPITAGPSSMLTANVLPTSAVGTVQFFDGSTAIGSPVTVTAGTATLSHTFASGSYSLKATFTPTDSTAFTTSTSSTVAYQVNPPATPTTTTLNITPASPSAFGTTLTYSATVSPVAAGTVVFLDGSTAIGSPATVNGSGNASLINSTLAAGSHSITAQFVPTSPASFQTSTSAATSYMINKVNSTVSLSASPATTAEQGANVTLTATVGPTGVGGGTVQFSYLVGSMPTAIGSPVAVSGTTATKITTTLPLTITGLRAVFTPTSANYNTSAASDITYAITPPPPGTTTTGLTVTPTGPVTQGTVETLHATVSPVGAAGTVQFFDGSTMLNAPVTVVGGVATTTATLSAATHSLSAMFLAANPVLFSDSSSSTVSYQVLPPAASTSTTLAVGPGSSEPYGTTLTFTGTVTPNTAAGTVQFKDGSTVLGSTAVVSGAASLSTSALHGGSHSITATFVPTSPLLFATSVSAPSAVAITAVNTTTSIGVSPVGPVSQGASVKLTAVLSPAAAAGTVAFRDGTTLIGTAAVVGGTATLTTKALPIGADAITATFTATHTGDYGTSTSAPAVISVLLPPSIASVFANGKLLQPGGTTNAGVSLQIHAQGFQPNETVTVDVHSTPIKVGTVKASATGFATVTIVLPTNLALGGHTLSMVGSIGTANFSFVVAKASSGSNGGGGLANTGVDAQQGLIVGLLLLTAGLMLIGAARRRGVRG